MAYLASQLDPGGKLGLYLTRIVSACQHLLGVASDVLDFSKIEAGKLQISAMPFSLRRMLDHVVGLFGDHIAESGLKLVVEIQETLPDQLIGDSLRIGQILINLLGNAIKFTEMGGVTLSVMLAERHAEVVSIRFEVEDTGVGIAADSLTSLFAPFHQIDGSRPRRFEGTGLGLAISKNLAELMGGHISAMSRPGIGSIFSFQITLNLVDLDRPDEMHARRTTAQCGDDSRYAGPARSIAPESEGASQYRPFTDKVTSHLHQNLGWSLSGDDPRWQALRGRRVLVVEDNAVNREVAQDLLELVGVQVVPVADGFQALKKLEADHFDLVLMDMRMPIMDGLETTRRIRAELRLTDLPVLALSANTTSGDRLHCMSAGMNDYIFKPIDPRKMYDTLCHWLSVQIGEARHDISDVEGLPDPIARDIDALRQVPGLMVDIGLMCVMDRADLYVKLVRRVLTERIDMPGRLRKAIQGDDFQAAWTQVHTMKSILGTLGATLLQERCIDLEAQLSKDSVDPDTLSAFEQEFATLLQCAARQLGLPAA